MILDKRQSFKYSLDILSGGGVMVGKNPSFEKKYKLEGIAAVLTVDASGIHEQKPTVVKLLIWHPSCDEYGGGTGLSSIEVVKNFNNSVWFFRDFQKWILSREMEKSVELLLLTELCPNKNRFDTSCNPCFHLQNRTIVKILFKLEDQVNKELEKHRRAERIANTRMTKNGHSPSALTSGLNRICRFQPE